MGPLDILKKYWGYDAFRPLQEEIVQSVLSDKHTLALLATGGGKSVCFQVPALLMDGICIVISPLIALMTDQVQQLRQKGILASAVHTGMPRREIDIVLDNCIYGKTKFLYVSPERLTSEVFIARLQQMNVSLVAVDEAHCISQWGYDFRPAYLEIKNLFNYLPDVKRIALTATATPTVREDIQEKLGFTNSAVFQSSFARENLSYAIFRLENKGTKLLEVLRSVPGSSVIYVRSRVETERLAKYLYQNGLSSDFYHAGIDSKFRKKKQEDWIAGRRRVMVATNAFGMGIDKSDVRTVIHMDLPDSSEAYYQEAGRAGRDGKKAYAVLLYSPADIKKLERNNELSNPDLELVKRVYQGLANYYKLAVGSSQWQSFDFDIKAFCSQYNFNLAETHHVVKRLEEMGLILLSDSGNRSSQLKIVVSQDELYRYTISNVLYEPVLKALLRLYGGGIYSDFLNIAEHEVAKMCKMAQGEVKKRLEYLSEVGIVVYDPIKLKPQMTFILPRQDVSSLKEYYQTLVPRQKAILEKTKMVISYAEQTHVCRTRFLQEYFGEVPDQNCGVCDICLQRKKESSWAEHQSEIRDALLTKLKQGEASIADLRGEFQIDDHFILTEVIREMLDEGVLASEQQGYVKLSNKVT